LLALAEMATGLSSLSSPWDSRSTAMRHVIIFAMEAVGRTRSAFSSK
jgi:hypothetical protein